MPAIAASTLAHKGHFEPGAAWILTWGREQGVGVGIRVRNVLEAEVDLEAVLTRSGQGEVGRSTLHLEWEPCRFGGRRAWLQCWCGRRVARLYVGSREIRCRHCFGLRYASQGERRGNRALRRARKQRARVGAGWTLAEETTKPKGMRWRTFERIEAARIEAEAVYREDLMQRWGWS